MQEEEERLEALSLARPLCALPPRPPSHSGLGHGRAARVTRAGGAGDGGRVPAVGLLRVPRRIDVR